MILRRHVFILDRDGGEREMKIYIYIYRERETETERETVRETERETETECEGVRKGVCGCVKKEWRNKCWRYILGAGDQHGGSR